jgi:2-phosphosulfolactate phosphatase
VKPAHLAGADETGASPKVCILQGSDAPPAGADVHVVIDVIRAFTVAHTAFSGGAKAILLVHSVDEALALRRQNPDVVLAGEIGGLAIPGFDLDNSPYRVSLAQLAGRTMVQKTTHGVEATLAALSARHVLVTGYSNALATALHVRSLCRQEPIRRVQLIASHASDDDDLACAEYLRDLILGEGRLDPETVVNRIRQSRPAAKFLAASPGEFDPRDLDFCTRSSPPQFAMAVDAGAQVPTLRKQLIAPSRDET